MQFFPAFMKLEKQKILIVGGGKIALEKLEKMLDFTSEITIVAKDVSDAMLHVIEQNRLTFLHKGYQKGDLSGFFMVIAAVDDMELQKRIFLDSREYNCLCNAVDLLECCDFIFPSYIKEGDLTVAISTSGTSPAFAKHFKRFVAKAIPDDIAQFLQKMGKLRESIPKGKERMQLLDEKVQKYIESWR
ncbi:MAG: bifunctional precorrin-2 dehydrogenase/sirohydrochlorin ferrochelatase [Epsilonproteobacteria bacterium]|nr:bifunctional precorrin-2 dehydrogenase/sirohydrochlorin ferrochelatase [Campylobacterota bacterium]